ncbi:hypothetical protein, partial [Brevibacterium linens]|uniref:hypothetical protein n=1 Tax=Brevibacterium linens TaxID=1703 RepID=UPI001C610D84
HLRGAPFLNGNVDFEHHHFPSSEGAFPFHARLDPATRIGGSRISVHVIFPIFFSAVVATIGGLIGVQLTSGSILQVLVSTVSLSVLTVASILMSALKGPMPVQFLASVPSPMGDPMVLTRAMWALDGLLTAIAAGVAVSALSTAPVLMIVVAVIPLVLIARRWRYRG